MNDYRAQSTNGPPRSSALAGGRLICALFGFIPFFPSIAAVILGHIALVKISRNKGRLHGSGRATSGLVLGYLGVAFWLSLRIFVVPIALPYARQTAAMNNMKCVVVGLCLYQEDYEAYPDDFLDLPTAYLPREIAAEIKAGRHDYVYVGNGLKLDSIKEPDRTIILYSKPVSLDNYINVGLANGKVIGVKAKDIEGACAKNNWILPKPRD